MLQRHQWWLTTAILLALLPVQAEAARLSGRILRVGFSGSSLGPGVRGTDHYRPGCWTPILVELDNTEGDLFDGELQAIQLDRDGDQIVASVPVSVRSTRQYYLYIPAGRSASQESFAVRVFRSDGTPADLYDSDNTRISQLLPPRPLTALPAEARVVLDISERPLNLAGLTHERVELTRPLLVSRVSPSALPDNVAGLEMADTIIWDGADPSAIDLAQRDALIQWTRRGGMLVLGVGRNWELVSRSRFGEMLPARLTGAEQTTELPELGDVLFGGESFELGTPITCCPIRLTDLAPDARVLVPAEPDAGSRLIVTRRPWVRGEVVLVAAEIREILSHAPQQTLNLAFLGNLLQVRRAIAGPEDTSMFMAPVSDVFQYPEQLTGFRVMSGIYFLVAFLFVAAYIGLGTGGTWLLLKRKNLTAHAWPAFAAVALAASAVSLAAVQMVRGIGHQVQQLTVVDARAGSVEAQARAYFGLKTGSHTLLDLQVPSDWWASDESQDIPGALRPLPGNPDDFSSVYSVGQRYEAIAAAGQLRSVPLRATLKQFEAVWDGRLEGSLSASLSWEGAGTTRLRPESWVENGLPVDLQDCFLFVTRTNVNFENRPLRYQATMVYPLGTLPRGQRLNWRQLLERRIQASPLPAAAAADSPDGTLERGGRLLSQWHEYWLGRRGLNVLSDSIDPWQAARMAERPLQEGNLQSALLLMTTFEEIDPRLVQQSNLARTRGWELDCSAALSEQSALLVGFALNDPGPLRLCWRSAGGSGRWRPIEPAQSRVMYRFRVPVR